MPTKPNDPRDDGAQARFRPALMAARAGVWDYDPDADRMSYCLGAARVLGLPSAVRRTGVPLARAAESVHPDDRGAYLARIAALRTRGGDVSAAFRTTSASGETRSILLQGRFEAADADGRRLHGQGVVIDVSDDADRGTSPAADAPEALPRFTALVTSIDLVIAARKALRGTDDAALTLIDALLMTLGQKLAAALVTGETDRGSGALV